MIRQTAVWGLLMLVIGVFILGTLAYRRSREFQRLIDECNQVTTQVATAATPGTPTMSPPDQLKKEEIVVDGRITEVRYYVGNKFVCADNLDEGGNTARRDVMAGDRVRVELYYAQRQLVATRYLDANGQVISTIPTFIPFVRLIGY